MYHLYMERFIPSKPSDGFRIGVKVTVVPTLYPNLMVWHRIMTLNVDQNTGGYFITSIDDYKGTKKTSYNFITNARDYNDAKLSFYTHVVAFYNDLFDSLNAHGYIEPVSFNDPTAEWNISKHKTESKKNDDFFIDSMDEVFNDLADYFREPANREDYW